MNKNELNFKTEIVIPEDYYNSINSETYTINDISQIEANINNSDPLIILKGLVGLKKLYCLEKEKEEPIQIYNNINILFNILENYPEEFKIECFRCLSSIEWINYKIKKAIINEPTDKIIQIIFYILDFPKEVKMSLLLENLDYLKYLVNNKIFVDKLGVNNIYKKIKNLVEKEYPEDKDIIESFLKILWNLYITNEQKLKDEQIILDLIPLLNNFLNKFESNQNILHNSLDIIFQITNNNNNNDDNTEIYDKIMNKLIEIKLHQKLIDKIDKFDTKEKDIIYCCLRIIGNYAAMENSYYTDVILENNFLDKLKKFIRKNQSFEIRKEATWILSNIAAGTNQQLTKLYENNFPYILFDIILNEEESIIKKNCIWSLYNFSNINNPEYLDILVEKGLIDIIIKRLKIEKGDTLCLSLEALNKILMDGKNKDPASFNIIQEKIGELNILNELKELLKQFQEEIIQEKITVILNNYFGIVNIGEFLNGFDIIIQ